VWESSNNCVEEREITPSEEGGLSSAKKQGWSKKSEGSVVINSPTIPT
jgi:hypothetical protein